MFSGITSAHKTDVLKLLSDIPSRSAIMSVIAGLEWFRKLKIKIRFSASESFLWEMNIIKDFHIVNVNIHLGSSNGVSSLVGELVAADGVLSNANNIAAIKRTAP